MLCGRKNLTKKRLQILYYLCRTIIVYFFLTLYVLLHEANVFYIRFIQFVSVLHCSMHKQTNKQTTLFERVRVVNYCKGQHHLIPKSKSNGFKLKLTFPTFSRVKIYSCLILYDTKIVQEHTYAEKRFVEYRCAFINNSSYSFRGDSRILP